jgi:hypothetical protein
VHGLFRGCLGNGSAANPQAAALGLFDFIMRLALAVMLFKNPFIFVGTGIGEGGGMLGIQQSSAATSAGSGMYGA